MQVLIIEDEVSNSKRLVKILKEIESEIKILNIIDSVEDSVLWLKSNPAPDLIFLDVQLSDGLSFEIFEKIDVTSPVIFTTAYDEYAIKAFTVNSVDYLLKPISQKSLTTALQKFHRFHDDDLKSLKSNIQSLLANVTSPPKEYKTRFLIKFGQSYKTLLVEDIAYFGIENQMTQIYTADNHRYPGEQSLDELESQLHPDMFFRINRQFIVNLSSIINIHTYFNSRLKLELKPKYQSSDLVIVSREKVKAFKEWLNR